MKDRTFQNIIKLCYILFLYLSLIYGFYDENLNFGAIDWLHTDKPVIGFIRRY